MGGKLVRAYSSMHWLTRVGIVLALSIIVLAGSLIIALAGSEIGYHSHTPAQGSVIGDTNPAIAVNVVASEGLITESDVRMTLDGITVTSEIATAGDEWIVSHIPADKLADGDHTVVVEVYDSLQAAYEETQWNFTVDAAPKIINLNPASESIVSVSNPEVSFTLRDTFNNLNGASLSVLLDGSPVDALLRYQGYPEYDACGNEYWIAESYQEATVSFQTSGLANGPHTVEFTIADTAGNVLHETWSFTVAADIVYSEHSPADGEVLGYANPVISVKAMALEGSVTPEDVQMTVGGAAVEPTLAFDSGNYIISYTPGTLDDGYYPVTVDIFNSGKGIYESTAWSFTVDTALTASDWSPGKDGTTSVSNPLVSVYVKSGVNRLDPLSVTASLNGSPVAATFMYKGYWVYDACGGTYVIESYKEGTVSFETADLANGLYNVEVRIANTAGNELIETWSFSVKTEIKFGEFSPTEDLTTEFGDPEISLWAYEGFIDKGNIIMLLDGNEVEHTVTDLPIGIRISHKPDGKLDEGVHNVIVNVYDSMNEDYQTTSWSFNVDARPKASEWVPAKGSTVTTAAPDISVLVTDMYDSLDETSATARLNGQPVPATFVFTAIYDACGGFYGYNYRQGTIKFNAAGLQDGVNLFEISIRDVAGNMLVETWSFTVAEAPKISSLDPADATEVGGISKVSAVVTDNTAVDWDSVKLYINNSMVAHTVNESTGEVAYNQEFTDVSYQVMLEASDTAGNQSTANWSFITVASPPTLTVLEFFSDNMTITDGVLKFYAKLNHQVDMKDNATLKLNGTPLEIDFRYQGYTDACTGYYIILSKKEAYVSYEKVVGDGQHTLELFAEDKFGNSRTWTWSLTVITPPSISNMAPVKYDMVELQPTISATVTDNDTIESIVFMLNGVTIDDFSYNPADGKLTYVPAVPLVNETNYTVSLAVTDGIGLTANKTWKFVLNTYPDMADSNISNCTICHQLFSSSYPSYGPFEDVHRPKLNFGGSHNNTDCDSCHNTITYPPNCGQCHYGDDECNEGTTPHGYSPDISYSARNYDPSIPLRVMQNREMWDCIICHQPGAGTKDRWGQLLTNHDIPELHKTSTEGCADCHALSLTREHARPERVDDAGGPVTCATCHQSAKTEVQTALANGDTSCAGCHALTSGGEGHAAMHNVSFGAQCVTCHGDNMMTEKVSHNNNCDGCHNSPDPVITSAIQLQNRTCFGCHTQPHGVQMSVIRDDMPRYAGATWSRPDPAIVWSSEGWLPDVLDNEMARVMFSARAEFDASEVYQYYRTEMGLKGWSILEETYSPENASFRLLFKKGRRHCLIWMYGGPSPLSGTSSPGTRRILKAYN